MMHVSFRRHNLIQKHLYCNILKLKCNTQLFYPPRVRKKGSCYSIHWFIFNLFPPHLELIFFLMVEVHFRWIDAKSFARFIAGLFILLCQGLEHSVTDITRERETTHPWLPMHNSELPCWTGQGATNCGLHDCSICEFEEDLTCTLSD